MKNIKIFWGLFALLVFAIGIVVSCQKETAPPADTQFAKPNQHATDRSSVFFDDVTAPATVDGKTITRIWYGKGASGHASADTLFAITSNANDVLMWKNNNICAIPRDSLIAKLRFDHDTIKIKPPATWINCYTSFGDSTVWDMEINY